MSFTDNMIKQLQGLPGALTGGASDPPSDPINPPHYRGDLVMRIIEKFKLGFRLGNVVKYILRHGEKAGLEDLRKAKWYLDREIAALEGAIDLGALQ